MSKRSRISDDAPNQDEHDLEPIQSVPGPRTRGATACQRCRSRKTKCNNLLPCACCEKIGALCVYDENRSLDNTAGAQILEAIGRLSALIESQGPPSSKCSGSPALGLKARPYSFSADDSHQSVVSPTAWVKNGLFVEHSNPVGPFGGIVQPILRPQGIESILRGSIFTGHKSKGPFFTGESQLMTRDSSLPNIRLGELLRLEEKYRVSVHSKNPILDLDELRIILLNLAENGFDWSTGTCLGALVCAIGAISQQYQDQHISPDNRLTPGAPPPSSHNEDLQGSEPQLALQFWHVAVKRLGSAIGQDDLQAAQCLCLAGIYYMHHLEPLQAWKYFNLAGSVWYSQNLVDYASGRRPSAQLEDKTVTVTQALYFTIWKSICELRLELDVPGVFDDVGLPHQFPLAPSLGEVESITPSNEATKYWFYYLAEIAARHQINRVASAMIWTPVIPTVQDVRRMLALADMFESNLSEWHLSLPPMFRFDVPSGYQMTPHADDYIQILRHRYLTCKELISRPFVRLCVETQLPYEEPFREDVLRRASVCLQYCMLKLSQVAPHRHQGSWYGLRNATASILILHSVNLAHRSLPTSRALRIPDDWLATATHAANIQGPMFNYRNGGASNMGLLIQSILSESTTPG